MLQKLKIKKKHFPNGTKITKSIGVRSNHVIKNIVKNVKKILNQIFSKTFPLHKWSTLMYNLYNTKLNINILYLLMYNITNSQIMNLNVCPVLDDICFKFILEFKCSLITYK